MFIPYTCIESVEVVKQGEQMISEENLDEESSPSQMQWYYRQTRAN